MDALRGLEEEVEEGDGVDVVAASATSLTNDFTASAALASGEEVEDDDDGSGVVAAEATSPTNDLTVSAALVRLAIGETTDDTVLLAPASLSATKVAAAAMPEDKELELDEEDGVEALLVLSLGLSFEREDVAMARRDISGAAFDGTVLADDAVDGPPFDTDDLVPEDEEEEEGGDEGRVAVSFTKGSWELSPLSASAREKGVEESEEEEEEEGVACPVSRLYFLLPAASSANPRADKNDVDMPRRAWPERTWPPEWPLSFANRDAPAPTEKAAMFLNLRGSYSPPFPAREKEEKVESCCGAAVPLLLLTSLLLASARSSPERADVDMSRRDSPLLIMSAVARWSDAEDEVDDGLEEEVDGEGLAGSVEVSDAVDVDVEEGSDVDVDAEVGDDMDVEEGDGMDVEIGSDVDADEDLEVGSFLSRSNLPTSGGCGGGYFDEEVEEESWPDEFMPQAASPPLAGFDGDGDEDEDDVAMPRREPSEAELSK